MNKKNLLIVALFPLATLASCGTGSSSSTSLSSTTSSISQGSSDGSSSLESTSSTSMSTSSSSVEVIPTVNLTDEMFAKLKLGYASTFETVVDYEGEASDSRKIFMVKCNEKNNEQSIYFKKDDLPLEELTRSYFHHYQINPDEDIEMLYDAGLSVGNDIIYTPIIGQDIHTYQDIELTWAEGHYSNVFIDLQASYFTRIGNENKFKLTIEDGLDAAAVSEIYSKLAMQFFGEEVTQTEMEGFYLLTNGDKITGFELNYYPYTSYDALLTKYSKGVFTDEGEHVVDFCKPLEGEKDEFFESAMKKLQTQNFHLEQTQQAFNYTTEKFDSQGKYVADFYNKESMIYDYYSANGKKYMSYGYLKNDDTSKRGVVPIEGEIYADYLYTGSLDELLPSFNLSSILFYKDTAASTADKAVYKLDNTIDISLDNDDSVFTPFDADGYNDRIIYLTVTIEQDKINIHNETSTSGTGLILDVNYTNFGGVENLVASDKYHETTEGLTWSQLLSNNQTNLSLIQKAFTKELLDSIPTITYCANIASEVGSNGSNPTLFFNVYDNDDNIGLLSSYGKDLEAAGFTFDASSVNPDETNLNKIQPVYSKNVTLNGRNYSLNIKLYAWWNTIQLWGQFQIMMSFSAAK